MQLRQILVPIDDSNLSDKVLDHALTLAERFVSHLHVLYVRGETRPGNIEEQRRDEANFEADIASVQQTALRRLRAGHTLPESHVHAFVMTGEPLECILQAATDHKADLIVMGTHGAKGLSDRLFGTTTERVLLQSKVAMFVVREDPPPVG